VIYCPYCGKDLYQKGIEVFQCENCGRKFIIYLDPDTGDPMSITVVDPSAIPDLLGSEGFKKGSKEPKKLSKHPVATVGFEAEFDENGEVVGVYRYCRIPWLEGKKGLGKELHKKLLELVKGGEKT